MTEETTTVTAVDSRRAEVAQYQANIAMYQSIVATLPSEYPAHLVKYKDTPVASQQTVITELSNLDDIALLSDLWMSDQCVNAIKTETLEMRKALSILKVLEAQA
jgi:hypothetical protein